MRSVEVTRREPRRTAGPTHRPRVQQPWIREVSRGDCTRRYWRGPFKDCGSTGVVRVIATASMWYAMAQTESGNIPTAVVLINAAVDIGGFALIAAAIDGVMCT